MNMIVKGRHIEVRPDVREYAEEKVGKVAKVLNSMVMSIEVELYHERNRSIDRRQVAEVTIHTKGPVIRARESAEDMKAAIDLVAAKLENQARRLKGKLADRHSPKAATPPFEAAPLPEEEEEEAPRVIVKTKVMELKPMSSEEAILQLELLGHDFFIYGSEDGEDVNVLYRRRDGDYGLIVPRMG